MYNLEYHLMSKNDHVHISGAENGSVTIIRLLICGCEQVTPNVHEGLLALEKEDKLRSTWSPPTVVRRSPHLVFPFPSN
jgi:hypothetical protein